MILKGASLNSVISMLRTRQNSLIAGAIIISIVVHLIILIGVPSFGMNKTHEYTVQDLSFLIGELRNQKNNWKSDDHEFKSKPIISTNKTSPVSLNESVEINKIMPEKTNIISLSRGSGEKKIDVQNDRFANSELISQQAKEIIKESEKTYNKSNVSPEVVMHNREKSYLERVRQQIQAKYFIPEESRMQNLKGKVTLKMKVSRKGTIIDVEVIKHSDFPLLDMAAIATVKAAAPFPDISDKIGLEYLTITVPFSYP